MINFNQKFHNTSKFRQAALFFIKHGVYTLAPRGTSDYNAFWKQETERCLNGYTAEDGEYVTGYHYFYLNYSPIYKLVEYTKQRKNGDTIKGKRREMTFPDFWDYDAYYFYAIEECEDAGNHIEAMKARQRGYSFKGASMLVRNYELIPGSQNFAISSEQTFLTKDGILNKAWDIMDFCDKNTAWAKKRLKSTALERVSGFKVKDELGNETEQGYKSAIRGVTLKNDAERIRGTRGKLMIWEEAGKFANLAQAWSVARSSMEDDTGYAFGLMIAQGTGGTEGVDAATLQDMFYHPKAYNLHEFDNVWDTDTEYGSRCSFFVPAWSNMFMDEDGNTLKDQSINDWVKQRQEIQDAGGETTLLDRFVAEHPLTPQESMLRIGGNIFPKKLLMSQLAKIQNNSKLQSMKHVVDLAWDNGAVIATEKKGGDITRYPLKNGDKPEGSVVIFEYPIEDPPYGLYIAGCDPYDMDESGTNSLGSVFIYKRYKPGEAWTDCIVAEYSGRPETSDAFYENVRKLLTLYNATLMFENQCKGIYPYFVQKHCDNMLADQPDDIISEIFKDSKVNRRKGCHMTVEIRKYGERKIKEWLIEEYAPGHQNLERIYSEPLLEELLLDDQERNVDRVIALCMVMIYKEQITQIQIKDAKEANKQVELFELPLFSSQYWATDEQTSKEDDIPVFTF